MTERNQDTSSPPQASEEAARARRQQVLIDGTQGEAEKECLRLAQALNEKLVEISRSNVGGDWTGRRVSAMQLALLDAMAWVKPVEAVEVERPTGHFAIDHDGFAGTVIGHYTTLEGKQGVVLQQDGTRVVHVYGEKWLKPTSFRMIEEDEGDIEHCEGCKRAVPLTAPQHHDIVNGIVLCEECAPTYREMEAEPEHFHDGDGDPLSHRSAAEMIERHLAAGGSIDDKIVWVYPTNSTSKVHHDLRA